MRRLSVILLTALPVPVAAQDQTFSLPGGCTGYLTVQSADCEVSHHFICENYDAGVQGRVDLGLNGPTYIGTIDAEAQWVNSFNPDTGSTETLLLNPPDAASFSALIGTGTDTYDFSTMNDQTGVLNFVGQDSLSGETVVIDGVTLEQTNMQIMVLSEDGAELWRTTGHEYISREWRMFLSGTGETTSADGSFKSDGSPVEFVFPGEPGFLSANPKFGCNTVISRATPDPLLQLIRLAGH